MTMTPSVHDMVRDARRVTAPGPKPEAGERAAPFTVVPVGDLGQAEPTPPAFWWDNYLPAGVVTLLGAHGGTGKSMLALMLGVSIPMELPVLGVPTRRGRVAFFSAEDGAELVRYRLRWICRALGVCPADLEGRLHILDATAGDPALFHEVSESGRRLGLTTPSYAALRTYCTEHEIDVLIVDNASDAFDASEIDRARVRGFMRALAAIAQERDGAVLLLAHVDKGTSRGDRTGSEGYSGSTAWHNSARSRLYLAREKDGSLTLEHQKANLGRLAEPLRLLWPEGGIPAADRPVEGIVQHIADGADTKALLKMLHEFYERGEFVATSPNSPANAARVLSGQRGFPKRKPAEVFDLLRDAERRRLIERQEYRSVDRKARERWTVTAAGCTLIGAPAPSAPSAPTPEPVRPGAVGARGAPSAPTPGVGGVGGAARAHKSAQKASA